MTAAFNLAQLANNLNTSGQLDATDGLNGLVANSNLASSGTASSSTFLRGDRTWATVTQRIVQVVSATYTTANTATTNTGSYASVFSASITPASTSNKILVIAAIGAASIVQSGNRSSIFSWMAIFRGTVSGTLLQAKMIGGDTPGGTGVVSGSGGHSMVWLDSPATTSAQTYTVGIKCRSDTSDITTSVNYNSSDNGGGTPNSSLILVEVLA